MPRFTTREQVKAWLAECEHLDAMRAILGQFHGHAPQPYAPGMCAASDAWQRRLEMHMAINVRAARAAFSR